MRTSIIQVSIKGESGQPTVARQLSEALRATSRTRTIFVPHAPIFRRLLRAFIIGLRISRSPRRFVVHLGLDGLILACTYRLAGKAVFINHGLYAFPEKLNALRNLYIFLAKIAAKRNNVFFVNSSHARAASSPLVFRNVPNTSGLIQRNFPTKSVQTIGLVGPGSGQKNTKILRKCIRDLKSVQFMHMARVQEKSFKGLPNYNWVGSNERGRFFRSVDLILIPSRYESFCLLAYEANYCNIPVLHSGVDGLSDLPFGHIVSPNCPDAWTVSVTQAIAGHLPRARPELSFTGIMEDNAKAIMERFI